MRVIVSVLKKKDKAAAASKGLSLNREESRDRREILGNTRLRISSVRMFRSPRSRPAVSNQKARGATCDDPDNDGN